MKNERAGVDLLATGVQQGLEFKDRPQAPALPHGGFPEPQKAAQVAAAAT